MAIKFRPKGIQFVSQRKIFCGQGIQMSASMVIKFSNFTMFQYRLDYTQVKWNLIFMINRVLCKNSLTSNQISLDLGFYLNKKYGENLKIE